MRKQPLPCDDMTEQTEQTEPPTQQPLEAAAVTHLEIPALHSLQQQTAEFFLQVFGWQISYDQMPNYGMTTNTQGKVSIGLPLVDEIYPIGSIYIHVDDIDQTLDTVERLGGVVLERKNQISEDIGFGATFKDLSGNTIGLFSPS